MGPKVFVKTALSTSKDPPKQSGVLRKSTVRSSPELWKRTGNRRPPRTRPGASGLPRFRHQATGNSPRLTQGSVLLRSRAVHSGSVNIKQVPKRFLEESFPILAAWWCSKTQIHGHHVCQLWSTGSGAFASLLVTWAEVLCGPHGRSLLVGRCQHLALNLRKGGKMS